MRTWWIAVCALAMGGAACLRSTEYHCAADPECNGGTCQAEGFCSFADSTCPTGQRFGEAAGSLASTCTGGLPGDGGVDSPASDGPRGDAPPADAQAACPSSYVTLPGGQAGHRYFVVTTIAKWSLQSDACTGMTSRGYLAIPDDAAELQALATAAATAPFWVGITDAVTEGTFVTTLGTPATFLPWEPGAPDDQGPGEDCVEATGATLINDQRCVAQRAAVCECVP